jgi:Smg protein
MFEVLVYLFETYYAADKYPDQDTITRTLSQAGFENRDIHDALEWLQALATEVETDDAPAAGHSALAGSAGLRIYASSEIAKLTAEARGFIAFLENAGVLSPLLRELIVERAMAVAIDPVDLEDIKVIALMVLWTREGSVDSLVLDALLPDGEPRSLH